MIKTFTDLQDLHVETVAKVIETDAVQKVPGVRKALREAKAAGKVAALASRRHHAVTGSKTKKTW
ncbi:hypothetical protein CCO03_00215 [Comamonas serinivorans]|uniref:Uncharacterized protein n=1 Tax=Comamonas serinivorans TaxID=1082851 RepID=A0A1Y0EIN7_9BURK|nr:hypothetical protein [Comamonas serinivorans]ARU03320.1 hypothetical protein CCO03_00215 [Comamonas serinivorans]